MKFSKLWLSFGKLVQTVRKHQKTTDKLLMLDIFFSNLERRNENTESERVNCVAASQSRELEAGKLEGALCIQRIGEIARDARVSQSSNKQRNKNSDTLYYFVFQYTWDGKMKSYLFEKALSRLYRSRLWQANTYFT